MIKKIVHIAPFEKFIKAANETFELAFPQSNIFFIIKNKEDYPYSLGIDTYKVLYETKLDLTELFTEIKNADFLFIHYLDEIKAKIITQLSYSSCKIVWIPWGGDVYENSLFYNAPLYAPKTQQMFFFKRLYIKLYNLATFSFFKTDSIKKCIQYIDSIAFLIPQEFELLKKTGLFKKDIKKINFIYYPLELIISKNLTLNQPVLPLDINSILVGNSANPTNNHLDAFELLKKLNIFNKKIITPLNYGDMKYSNKIVNLGKKNFGEYFFPITDFMSLDAYNKLISSCGFAIMNHYRQQAVGNIITLLWAGTKVFLDEKNLVYHFLKDIGCIVFSIRQDLYEDNLTLLSQAQVQHNRNILIENFSISFITTILKQQLHSLHDK